MMRLLGFAALLAAALLQVTWAPGLAIWGAYPNLVLLMMVVITWRNGARAGMFWACWGGVLLDLTGPGPLGPHALALLAGAYVSGFWTRNVDAGSLYQPVLATAASTVLYSLILIGSDDTLGLPVPPLGLAFQLTFAASIYNAALMLPLLLGLRRAVPLRRQPA